MSTVGIASSLASFRQRAMLVAGVRATLVAVVITALAAELVGLRPDLVGTRGLLSVIIVTVVAILGTATAIVYAWRHRPSALDAARRIDRVARLQDVVVTALERESQTDEMSAAVCRSAAIALARVAPSRVYLLEAPRRWREWAALAVAVQIVAIALVWRAPEARPMAAAGSALSMPGGPGAPGAEQAPAPRPQGLAASAVGEAGTAAQPIATSQTAGSRPDTSATDAPTDAAMSGAGAATGQSLRPATGDGSGETATGSNRYRQAAGRAGDAIAQGRVPAALRGVVERYFSAIRLQGK